MSLDSHIEPDDVGPRRGWRGHEKAADGEVRRSGTWTMIIAMLISKRLQHRPLFEPGKVPRKGFLVAA